MNNASTTEAVRGAKTIAIIATAMIALPWMLVAIAEITTNKQVVSSGWRGIVFSIAFGFSLGFVPKDILRWIMPLLALRVGSRLAPWLTFLAIALFFCALIFGAWMLRREWPVQSFSYVASIIALFVGGFVHDVVLAAWSEPSRAATET